jgi:V8-like Glu-specific endopeptidase
MKIFTLIFFFLIFSCQKKDEAQKELLINKSKYVFGKDGRVQVRFTSAAYQKAVGLLSGEDDQGRKFSCTASIIGEDLLLTAAHCLLNPKTKMAFQRMTFIPRHTHSRIQYKRQFFVHKAWIKNSYLKENDIYKKSSGDMAFLEVSPIKGWGHVANRGIQLNPTSANWEQDRPIGILGYSSDKAPGTLWQSGCMAFKAKENLFHQCDLKEGNSGAPVFSLNSRNQPDQLIALSTGGLKLSTGKMNRGNPFTDQDIIDYTHLKLKEYNLIENFTPFDLGQKAYQSINVQNTCSQKIQFIMKFKNQKNQEILRTWNISKTSKGELIRAHGENLYYSARLLDGPKRWEGTDQFISVKGKSVGLIKLDFLNTNKSYIQLSCP